MEILGLLCGTVGPAKLGVMAVMGLGGEKSVGTGQERSLMSHSPNLLVNGSLRMGSVCLQRSGDLTMRSEMENVSSGITDRKEQRLERTSCYTNINGRKERQKV